MRKLSDPGSLWKSTSMGNRMKWLTKCKVHVDKLVEYANSSWTALPAYLKLSLGTMK